MRLREQVVKDALAKLDWNSLQAHLDQIGLSRDQLTELCGHIRRCSDWICKYPRKQFEKKRGQFLNQVYDYAVSHFGTEVAIEVSREIELLGQVEHGYRSILDMLGRCDIGKRPAELRTSGVISIACHGYQELERERKRLMAESSELNLMSGPRVTAENGQNIPVDAILDGLSESVAMTLIMEAYKNDWFASDKVVLPTLTLVDEVVRHESSATQVLALCWRQWQRLEKRRRFLGGELRFVRGGDLPPELPKQITTLITYQPEEGGLTEREVYDYLANTRLSDRLTQTYLEMEIESGLSGKGVGIIHGAALPPSQHVSSEEVHACVSLSEVLGYSVVDDNERPAGLRLLEWVRGYIVLKEIGKARTKDENVSADAFAIHLEEAELITTLQACGLKDDVALHFIEHTCLHASARDMFDCPLVRVGPSGYLLFAPAVIDTNVAMVVLSNLSNRGTELSRKGKAFERVVQEVFRKRNMPVFGFRVHRGGEEFEYDAVVPWGEYLFVFECKNRSLSSNDPVQVYYFDLEITSQARQVKRLADALVNHPDIVEREMGAQYADLTVIPCVLHSLPYSRMEDVDGVYFTDWSALTRFFDQPYFRIKVPHRVGNATILHRTAIRKFWKGDAPTAKDFLHQLEDPFQLELSMKHLRGTSTQFAISEPEIVITQELTRAEMSTRSICEAVGVDADKVLQEIAAVGEKTKELRLELDLRITGKKEPISNDDQ